LAGRHWLLLAAALLAAAGTARLGWWQLDRAAQKTALFEARQRQGSLPPLNAQQLAQRMAQVDAQLYRRVQLEGTWLAEHTVYLDNRQMDGRPGFYMVTPLRLAPGDNVLVQRGWLPRDPRDRTRLASVPTPTGTVQLHGHIAPGLARLYEFAPAASGAIRQNLDVQAYALQIGENLRPLVVVQEPDPAAPADGLRRQWQPAVLDVSKHHGYALQWFSLSALIMGLYVWFQLIRPRRRP
jgi:surfeit locus 1 family protein